MRGEVVSGLLDLGESWAKGVAGGRLTLSTSLSCWRRSARVKGWWMSIVAPPLPLGTGGWVGSFMFIMRAETRVINWVCCVLLRIWRSVVNNSKRCFLPD
jgi:hypothetical protein